METNKSLKQILSQGNKHTVINGAGSLVDNKENEEYVCSCNKVDNKEYICKMAPSRIKELKDSNGVDIKIGDLLEETDCNGNVEYHFAYPSIDWTEMEIRDLNGNNVCMLDVDNKVINLGNYKDNLDKLDDDDIEYIEDRLSCEPMTEEEYRDAMKIFCKEIIPKIVEEASSKLPRDFFSNPNRKTI